MNDLIEASEVFVSLLESDKRPKFQRLRDERLGMAAKRIRLIFKRRFAKQRKSIVGGALLARISQTLKDRYPRTIREAEKDPDRVAMENEIIAALSPVVQSEPITVGNAASFRLSMRQAVQAGADAVTDHLDAITPQTDSFIAEYLKDAGLSNLTGEIDQTTTKRLASAIADAYESGEDFDGVVKAVKAEFQDFSTKRLQMIAQTEINEAYNQGVMEFGRQAGATKKSWTTDLTPCVICVENSLDGEIDFDEDFTSGDEAPPAHPNCLCSLMVHT